jgi:apolipoprotein N-acyltransferase
MVNPSDLVTNLDFTAIPATGSTQGVPSPRSSWSREDLLPALSGLLLGLAFAPTNLFFLAFVGLVPLFVYLDKPLSRRRIIRAGLICPWVLYGFTLSWLAGMVKFSWLSVPGYICIIWLYVFSFFVFILPVVMLKKYLSLPFWATAPFAWVACEGLRGYGDMAFPWGNLGCSLTGFPFLIQFADIAGVFGVSFWLVLLNALLFEAISARRDPVRCRRLAVAWVAVFGLVNLYNTVRWFRGITPAGYQEVAVIQPNVPQKIKWDDRYARQILEHMFTMNAVATTNSTNLVVWPETAIPYYIDESKRFQLTQMGTLPQGNTYVLTGLLTSSRDRQGQVHYFNAAALFNSQGERLGVYKKMYLVPVAEKYPFRSTFGFTRAFFPIHDISYGAMDAGTELTVFRLPGASFSAMICYESVYPQVSRKLRLAGSNFLVNITNDAWFGHSFAPSQHASFLVLRAIENREAIVRCGNTGISGFVDPLGRWQQKTKIFTETIISQKVPITDKLTFYTRFGDLIVYVSYTALGGFFLLALRKKTRTRGTI